jgi:hypothetical protein
MLIYSLVAISKNENVNENENENEYYFKRNHNMFLEWSVFILIPLLILFLSRLLANARDRLFLGWLQKTIHELRFAPFLFSQIDHLSLRLDSQFDEN